MNGRKLWPGWEKQEILVTSYILFVINLLKTRDRKKTQLIFNVDRGWRESR